MPRTTKRRQNRKSRSNRTRATTLTASVPPQGQRADRSDAILERMKALHPKIIDLSLDRVTRLLDGLGNPERQLPPVVHFAGTNGKGSSLAFLRAMFEAAGYRVHAYTSPHLVRFHERIRLAGDLIPEPELAALLAECEAANGPTPITYFEITTAAALAAFARSPADVLLLETGLGGRLLRTLSRLFDKRSANSIDLGAGIEYKWPFDTGNDRHSTRYAGSGRENERQL